MKIIKDQIIEILKSQGINNVQFNIPPQKVMGDLSSALAISQAKKSGKKPIDLAEELKSALDGKIDFIKNVTISEPGYLNFFIDYEKFGNQILSEAISKKSLIKKVEIKDKISIEHTGVNPNKAMHIGHIRNSIIGDIMFRLHEIQGYNVQALNYIDDTGIQLADTVTALLYLDEPRYEPNPVAEPTGYQGGFDIDEVGSADKNYVRHNKEGGDIGKMWNKWNQEQSFDYFCWDIYARFSAEVESGNENLLKMRKEVFTKIEEGGNEIAKFAKELAIKIVEAHIQTCEKLNISFDLLIWESDIIAKGLWDKTFELLKEKNIITLENDGPNSGCWIIKAGGVEKSADEEFSKDKILVKSDGTLTYTAKDLAYQLWKLGKLGIDFDYSKWGESDICSTSPSDPGAKTSQSADKSFGKYDRVINVIDNRQSYPQEIIKETIKKLGYLNKEGNYHHLSYGVVNLTDKAAQKIGADTTGKNQSMSGRKGVGVKADDLIVATAEELDKKANNEEISKILASSAIRFYMAKFTSNQNINFDFDEALQTNGESGIYLSYSYARATSILIKSNYKEAEFRVASPSTSEQNLINKISEFEDALVLASQNLEPSIIARYSFELCSAFSDFYENTEPIYKTKGELQQFRLSLVKVFTIVLQDLFSILGIEPLEKI